MDASIAPEETLADVLGARARRTPFDRLILDVAGGLLIGAAAIWARPPAWVPLLAASACFAFYGCWAVIEQRMHADPSGAAETLPPLWRVARQAAALLGLVAFAILLFSLLGVALGPIIS